MRLQSLLTRLGPQGIETWQKSDLNVDITGSRPLSASLDAFFPHILYYGELSSLPQIPPTEAPLNLICLADVPVTTQFRDASNLNLFLLRDAARAEAVFTVIREECTENPQITAGMNLLLEALFSDQGIQHLVDVAYKVFHNPVFIADPSYKYIACTQGVELDYPDIEEEKRLGYILDKNVEGIRRDRLDDRTRKNRYPLYHPDERRKKGMLVTEVTIQGVEVAHIALYEMNRPFEDSDYILLYRLSKLVSQELQKSSLFTSNRDAVTAYLLADLIERKPVATQSLAHRLQIMGHTLKKQLYVLTLSPQTGTSSPSRIRAVTDGLLRILPNSIHVVYQETIVLLTSRDPATGLTEHEQAELEAFCATGMLNVGVSRPFSDIAEFSKYYQQSLKASELGAKLHAAPGVYRYGRYAVYQLVEYAATNGHADDFIDPDLLRLQAYDRENKTQLVETLRLHLQNAWNPAATAEALHVHKNTLFYRMEKIRSMLDGKLEDGDKRLALAMSLCTLDYLHAADR